MRLHQPLTENGAVRSHAPKLYSIRVKGHLGATALAAFPEMVSQQRGADSILTGILLDRSALFGILTQIEALRPKTPPKFRLPDPKTFRKAWPTWSVRERRDQIRFWLRL